MAGGRPKKYSKEKIKNIIELLDEYIKNTDIPILAEFAYTNELSRESIYDYEEFSTLRKRCIAKKEAQLERMALKGDVNTTMAIFSLKQIGWSDKQEHEITGKGGDPFKIEIEVVHAKK